MVGHSLMRLARQIEETYPDVSEIRRELMRLNQYYVPTRYPDALAGSPPSECYDREQAAEAVEFAEKAVAFARSIIPE